MMTKKEQRLRRSRQTRARIAIQRAARLTVFRSNLHIYAQVLSEDGAKVLAAASTAEIREARYCGPRFSILETSSATWPHLAATALRAAGTLSEAPRFASRRRGVTSGSARY